MTRSRPLLVALIVAACGGGGEGTTPPVRTLQVTVTGGVTDTVFANPAPLIATVTWSDGEPAAGQLVRIQNTTVVPGPGGALTWPIVLPVQSGVEGFEYLAGTNAAGEVVVPVRLENMPGAHYIRASVVGADADSALYMIVPGRPVSMSVLPADTSIQSGRSYPLRVSVSDQSGNASPVAATFSSLTPATLGVDGTGSVSSLGLGRGHVRVETAGFVDSAAVSVVPSGTLVAGSLTGIFVFDTDGAGFRRLVEAPHTWTRWSPSGTEIVATEPVTQRLYRFDLAGTGTRLTPHVPFVTAESRAQYSRDGAWVYYTAHFDQVAESWRVRPDGSQSERAGPAPGALTKDLAPSPSGDGSRLSFVTNRESLEGPFLIRILTPSTGAIDSLDVSAEFTSWSPVSDVLAHQNAGRMNLVGVDGTGATDLDPGLTHGQWENGSDWSPDGNWIVGCVLQGPQSRSLVALVRVATREVLPLAFTQDLCWPSWKP